MTARIERLAVVHRDETRKAEVLDVLARYVEMAERGELLEVLVVAINQGGELVMGSSGQVTLTEQIGALERFKAFVIEQAG